MTVREFRIWARSALSPLLDLSSTEIKTEPGLTAEIIAREVDLMIMEVLGCDLTALHRCIDHSLSEDALNRLRNYVARRLDNEPLAYVLGKWWFYSLELFITPDVLIPRRETELLVEKALDYFDEHVGSFVLIDVGTGSGAIVISVLHELRKRYGANYLIRGHSLALDISGAALKVAAVNARMQELEGAISFVESDLLSAVNIRVEPELVLILANLPYVPENDELPPNVAVFEPRIALRGGSDGATVMGSLISEIGHWRSAKIAALLEIGVGQKLIVESLARQSGFDDVKFYEDLSGIPRVMQIQG